MKITFLGTGAASSCPLAFCRCSNCRQARELGGKNIRKRSSLLVNQDLLIDLGPDAPGASFTAGIPLSEIHYWLQTHPHSDHFDPGHLVTRVPEYMGEAILPLKLFASRATLARMSEMLRGEGEDLDLLEPEGQKQLNLEVFPLQKFQSVTAGRYEITAFTANHDPVFDSLLFSITEDGFTLFYGSDTNILPEETWQAFHEKQQQFDVVVLDHTYGPGTSGGGHLNADTFIATVQRMQTENLLADGARILATHISHEGNPLHEALSRFAAANGYEIAYDGMQL